MIKISGRHYFRKTIKNGAKYNNKNDEDCFRYNLLIHDTQEIDLYENLITSYQKRHEEYSIRERVYRDSAERMLVAITSVKAYDIKLRHAYVGSRTLVNLTKFMCTDAFYKLRVSDVAVDQYKGSEGYELGVLAENVMDNFEHMIKIYRTYSKLDEFKAHKYTDEQMLNALQIVQSDFEQLKLEKELFEKSSLKHKKSREPDSEEGQEQLSLPTNKGSKGKAEPPSGPPGRRANVDQQNKVEGTKQSKLHIKYNKETTKQTAIRNKKSKKVIWNKNGNIAEQEYKNWIKTAWVELQETPNADFEGVFKIPNLKDLGNSSDQDIAFNNSSFKYLNKVPT